MKTITKVLIANRGEISCRVTKTARSMGIATVAVFCDAETNGKHVTVADEAYRVGPPPATTSYLLGEKMIETALKSGAQAIHPGYGFLSENADFAEAVQAAGIEFIGPPSSAIKAMGSKSESKILMMKANVPVLEGYNGEAQGDALLIAEAKKIGYPVLIKAVMGGGGKGMKLVHEESDFLPQLESARREATNFFKDDRVIIERYVTTPRHIEVQVLCDKHGNGFYFYERDCSVQRRHQKVLEECPAMIPREIAKAMGEVAVRAAKAVVYVGAGTVEFIYDAAVDKYYFMEMNTRLQVEHPVTEEAVRVAGEPLDLVKLQLLVAMGHKLSFSQSDITTVGHAIEARVYAESPRDGFLPGSGHLAFVEEPIAYTLPGEAKVRVDTGFRSGDDVLVFYDPMIAKVIAWGKDRASALEVLHKALRSYHVVGIPTNITFLQRSLRHPQFMAGGVTTKFIEDNKEQLLAANPPSAASFALVAANLLADSTGGFTSFRANAELKRTVRLVDGDKVEHALCVTVVGDGCTYRVGATIVRIVSPGVAIVDDSARVNYRVVRSGNTVALLTSGEGTVVFTVPQESFEGQTQDPSLAKKASGKVKSPLNGKVVKLCVAPGETVKKGQTIVILEAMKMEHNVKAPFDGKVTFHCKAATMVAVDSVLAEVVA